MILLFMIKIFVFLAKLTHRVRIKCTYYKEYLASWLFNNIYLPREQAKKMPIWVRHLHFFKWSYYKGKIVIDSDKLYPRMIRLGAMYNSWYPDSGITLQLDGTIVFKGKCIIGNDVYIYVSNDAVLTIGEDCYLGASNRLICDNRITIGNHTRFGWNCMLLDTDFHYMTNINDKTTNMKISAPISLGKNNWLGNGVTVFKGFATADFVTIGAGSKCRGKVERPYTVWANDGKLHLLAENVYRDLSKDKNIWELIN